jgi:hypothetical protein
MTEEVMEEFEEVDETKTGFLFFVMAGEGVAVVIVVEVIWFVIETSVRNALF